MCYSSLLSDIHIWFQCITGRYSFQFVSQVMEKLREDTFHNLFLERLTSTIKSSLNQIHLAYRNPKKKGMIGLSLIDPLFYYFQLLECLVLALKTIDVCKFFNGLTQISRILLRTQNSLDVYYFLGTWITDTQEH